MHTDLHDAMLRLPCMDDPLLLDENSAVLRQRAEAEDQDIPDLPMLAQHLVAMQGKLLFKRPVRLAAVVGAVDDVDLVAKGDPSGSDEQPDAIQPDRRIAALVKEGHAYQRTCRGGKLTCPR